MHASEQPGRPQTGALLLSREERRHVGPVLTKVPLASNWGTFAGPAPALLRFARCEARRRSTRRVALAPAKCCAYASAFTSSITWPCCCSSGGSVWSDGPSSLATGTEARVLESLWRGSESRSGRVVPGDS